MLPDASAWGHAHKLHATVHVVHGDSFQEIDLVTDDQTVHTAMHTDPNLLNPWGVAIGPTGLFWVNDNNSSTFTTGAGVVTIYDANGVSQSAFGHHAISIAPPMGGTTSTPTGEVFNRFGGFDLAPDKSALFLFATEDGTISGWNPQVNAGSSVLEIDNSTTLNGYGVGNQGEVYKGLAIAHVHGKSFLYATDFRDGRVEVYNSQFQPVKSFTDPNVPTDYSPFNVQVLDNHLFVTFAVRNSVGHDDVAGLGKGFVDEFNFNGTMVARVASHGPLDSPWGLAIAPKGFGKFAGDLLVGNFGNGEIHAYDLHTDKLVGVLRDDAGHIIRIGDLWALIPGSNSPGGHPNSLYFTAGVSEESHGLFGRLVFHHDLHM